MYFIGLVVFVVLLVSTALFSNSFVSFVDLPSIILILAFTVPMLMASGLFPDFIRAFKIMGQKINTCSLLELKKTEIALGLMIRLLLLSGLLGSTIGAVAMLSNLTDISKLGPNLALVTITLLYSLLIVFILLPVKARVNAIIQAMD